MSTELVYSHNFSLSPEMFPTIPLNIPLVIPLLAGIYLSTLFLILTLIKRSSRSTEN